MALFKVVNNQAQLDAGQAASTDVYGAGIRFTQDGAGDAMLGALLEVVRSSCPDLTDKEVEALTVDQIAALIQLSRNQVSEVEAMLAERSEKN